MYEQFFKSILLDFYYTTKGNYTFGYFRYKYIKNTINNRIEQIKNFLVLTMTNKCSTRLTGTENKLEQNLLLADSRTPQPLERLLVFGLRLQR